MKKTIAITSLLALIFSSFGCVAADEAPGLSYDKNSQTIKSSDGASSIKFEERDEGNSSYYFDYFGGLPSIVHDSDSLDSYSAYSIIGYGQHEPSIECIYVDFKSGNNGVMSKEGRCGLDLKGNESHSFSGDEGDTIVNNIIGKINDINTAYLIKGKVNYLPIMMFQNKEQFVYKLYETSESLNGGSYKIISCGNNNSGCNVYSNKAWVVINNTDGVSVKFEELKKINGHPVVDKAVPDEVNTVMKNHLPFNVKSLKAYLHSSSGEKLKSYLVQGDKVTLLNINSGKCSIRYINSKNKSLDGNIACSDLNLYN